MKLVAILLLLLAGAVAGVTYINHQNETQVYQFCSQMAAGNDETVIDQFLADSTLTEKESPDLTQRWVSHSDTVPLTDRYICQIFIEQQKIVELNVVKQGVF
ncbi:hypothetical protein [Pleionea mediterranea]|uniref:Uncharacterized protein n=1 Tax=Pleionea mediterranea TaxID=523701 RepID=A0A316FZ62_9GAMM|nr:hypothetical protein [Pleionea mediterranea]PWK52986.1 hypothetical protein C8D97_104204 [Pleionea mediterranea]